MTLQDFPALNATLNGASTVLLLAGFVCIKARKIKAHATMMISAFIVSAAFLVCYITYHAQVHDKTSGLHASTLRTVYWCILVPHVLLAFTMVPMILITLRRAWKRDWPGHRRIAVWTFPIWLYVSVTGVIIYWMLYHLFPSLGHGS